MLQRAAQRREIKISRLKASRDSKIPRLKTCTAVKLYALKPRKTVKFYAPKHRTRAKVKINFHAASVPRRKANFAPRFEIWYSEFTPTRTPASRHKSKRFEILRLEPPRVVIFLQREPEVAFKISRFEFLRRKPAP